MRVAPVELVDGAAEGRPVTAFERRLLAAAVLAWLVTAIMNLLAGPPLGHDEAMFSLIARGHEMPFLYRSRGVTTVAELGVALGGADWQMRLASTGIGASIVLAVFAAGRAIGGARTGAWAAAVIAGGHQMAWRSAELLGDLPAAAGIVAGVAVLAAELPREAGPRWRIVLAAPAFAAAFYFRYGSAPVIALAGAGAAVLWWRVLLRPAAALRALAAAALFALLLVPHAVHSLRETGALLGVLRFASGVPHRAYYGEGLVTYLTSNPFHYYGALVAPLMLAGLVGLAGLARERRRAPWFLAWVALGQLLLLGLQSHAQPRYVFAAVALLTVLGVEAVQRHARRARPAGPRLALALVAATWLGCLIACVVRNTRIAERRTTITLAAAAIRADVSGASCVAFSDTVHYILEWYARCEAVDSAGKATAALEPGREHYFVSLPYGARDGSGFAGRASRELPTGDARVRVWKLLD